MTMRSLIERIIAPEFHGRDKAQDANLGRLCHPHGGPISIREYCDCAACEEDRGMLK